MYSTEPKYTPIPSSKNGRKKSTFQNLRHSTLLRSLVTTFILVVLLALSFFGGLYFGRNGLRSAIELDTRSETFQYNRSFGEPPSEYTNAVWAELFPKQGGFFKHPTLAPRRSAFSVFHQLHCLDGIRQGYWAVFDAAVEAKGFNEDDLPMMSSPPHIRHCIDLLRRSLMCNPDITIEVKDDSVGGVKGFGTEHQCKDWAQLVTWTSNWETYDQDPRFKGNKQVEHARSRRT